MTEHLALYITRGDSDDDEWYRGFAILDRHPEWASIINSAQQAVDAAAARLPTRQGEATSIVTLLTPLKPPLHRYCPLTLNEADNYYNSTEERAISIAATSTLTEWCSITNGAGFVRVPEEHWLQRYMLESSSNFELGIVRHASNITITNQGLVSYWVFLKDEDWETNHYPLSDFISIMTDPTSGLIVLMRLPLEGGE